MLRILIMIAAFFSTPQLSASPIDTYQFNDEVTKVRFQALSKELRCPKCQNQNLADSNSPIAQDLRREVYLQLMDGRSDSEIVTYMVDRYGEFVLYRPKVNSITYILWFGPAVFILIGVIVVVYILRNRPKKEAEQQKLSEADKAKLDDILKD